MITFHEIYERYAGDIYRYACWLSGRADDADDITSETFARAWAARDEIRTETVKAYLLVSPHLNVVKGLIAEPIEAEWSKVSRAVGAVGQAEGEP